ncbi:Hemerythrin HHE cation binding domain-containing protein [Prauserella aidingensis]|uniref:hemerythrin domain-containing protein n=1 Tax=Prauserella aidingensis TaxID=387890 RepID=UPI0020A51D69|nr:hemerythrin domain-containing protein [Prauserella aidingensis]MCP2254144.1 Hemerythrin HHE cation binding domain-containing protein [Prauserella aidingensis]
MTWAQADVVDVLLDQHRQVKTLLAEVREASGDARRRAFDDLVRLLAVHEVAEEEVVHPVARDAIDNGTAIVDDRLAEEDEAKHALAELHEMGVDHAEFDERFARLAHSVTRHAEQEESREFRVLRQRLGAAQLEGMRGAVKAAEDVAPTRPHPGIGESAPANMLAGPPLAVFDRIRDAVRDWRNR